MIRSVLFILLLLTAGCPAPTTPSSALTLAVGSEQTLQLDLPRSGEARLSLKGSVAGAAWNRPGTESITLRVVIDRAVQRHLVWATGAESVTHALSFGELGAGPHSVLLQVPAALSRAQEATLTLDEVRLQLDPDPELARHAPIVLGKDDSGSNDLPLLLFGQRTAAGTLRYTVLYSSEDGGTGVNPRSLMARWGRFTDIEWALEVQLDEGGNEIASHFQGIGHLILPFKGPREGTHPILRVATANGLFSDDGFASKFRFAPAVIPIDDPTVPRERMMDRFPWTHRIADEEGEREGKLDPTCEDPSKLWATRCYLRVDLHVEATPALVEERRIWGVELQSGTALTRSELDLGAIGRMDRQGPIRLAIPLQPGSPVDALRLYAVGDGQPFELRARRFHPDTSGLGPEARVTHDDLVAPLLPAP